MPNTPVYGWPYQALSDPPDGAALGEDLSLAIEATMNAVDVRLGVAEADIAALEAIAASLPGQIIARGRRPTSSPTTTTTEIGVLRLDAVPVLLGRVYGIYTSTIQLASTVANDGIASNLRLNAAGIATTASTSIGTVRDQMVNATTGFTGSFSRLYVPSADVNISVLITVVRVTGSGNCLMTGSADSPIELWVVDHGDDPGDTGVDI